jgi:hypothetical protein
VRTDLQNTSGESKNAVFTRLGQQIWPEYALINKKIIAQRTKNKYDAYVGLFIFDVPHTDLLVKLWTG